MARTVFTWQHKELIFGYKDNQIVGSIHIILHYLSEFSNFMWLEPEVTEALFFAKYVYLEKSILEFLQTEGYLSLSIHMCHQWRFLHVKCNGAITKCYTRANLFRPLHSHQQSLPNAKSEKRIEYVESGKNWLDRKGEQVGRAGLRGRILLGCAASSMRYGKILPCLGADTAKP